MNDTTIAITVHLPESLLHEAALRYWKEMLGTSGRGYASEPVVDLIRKAILDWLKAANLEPLIEQAASDELRIAVAHEVRAQLRKLVKAVVKEEAVKGTLFENKETP